MGKFGNGLGGEKFGRVLSLDCYKILGRELTVVDRFMEYDR